MTSVFPIIATVARIEYVVRVKVVIPGRGWFGTAVDEFELFIFAACRIKSSIDSFVLIIALSIVYSSEVFIFLTSMVILSLINLREIKR